MIERPRKSDRTRARILQAARTLFGERGFEGVSVREIAAMAEADPALVIRYFKSKERLFAAAADIELHLPDLTGAAPHDVGARLAAHFIDVWEDPRSGPGLRIILRSAPTQKDVAERARMVFAQQVMPAIRVVDRSGASDWKAALIASQVLGIALTRYILELPAIADMPADRVAGYLGRLIQTVLEAD